MPGPYGDATFHAINAIEHMLAQGVFFEAAILVLEGVRRKRDRLEEDIASFEAVKADYERLKKEKADATRRVEAFRKKWNPA